MYFSGIIGGICTVALASQHAASPIKLLLDEVFNLMDEALESLVCFVALATCLVLVCEGLRAEDNVVGGRVALAGVAGATGTLYCSRGCFEDLSWFFDEDARQLMSILLFSLPLVASIAIKLEYTPSGFLAVVCAFSSVVVTSSEAMEHTGIGGKRSGVVSVVLASLTVDVLFGLAFFLATKARQLQLFASGIMATGVFALHLALFVNSFPEWDDVWHRVLLQLPVCAGLIAGWSLGRAVGSEGLKNNSLLFGALYVASTILSQWERSEDSEASLWVGILSLGAWRFGVYLRAHDGFVASLWTLDAGLVW
eukprot:g13514.t1